MENLTTVIELARFIHEGVFLGLESEILENVLEESLLNEEVKNNKHVLSEKGEKDLKKEKYSSKLGKNPSCPIEQTEFKEGDEVIKLPCEHLYKEEGIRKWLKEEKAECPICRYKLDSVVKENNEVRRNNEEVRRTHNEVRRNNNEEVRRTHNEVRRNNNEVRRNNNEVRRNNNEVRRTNGTIINSLLSNVVNRRSISIEEVINPMLSNIEVSRIQHPNSLIMSRVINRRENMEDVYNGLLRTYIDM